MLAVSWLWLSFLALPFGQGVAFCLSGEGFVWPSGQLITSVIGLLHGEVGLGLPGPHQDAVPADALVYGAGVTGELAVWAGAAWGLAWWWRSVGPGAQFGIATSHEVQTVLGAGNLRRRRRVIRPDLYPEKPRPYRVRRS